MTVLSQNVEDMLKRLETHSQAELNLIRALSDAIRQVDDQTLRELRNLTLQHELRRETILTELQGLAQRLCQLPPRASAAMKPAIDPPHHAQRRAAAASAVDIDMHEPLTPGALPNGHGGADWRQAAQNIEDELDLAFGHPAPRH